MFFFIFVLGPNACIKLSFHFFLPGINRNLKTKRPLSSPGSRILRNMASYSFSCANAFLCQLMRCARSWLGERVAICAKGRLLNWRHICAARKCLSIAQSWRPLELHFMYLFNYGVYVHCYLVHCNLVQLYRSTLVQYLVSDSFDNSARIHRRQCNEDMEIN